MTHFCKMEAQGNDFVVIDGREQPLPSLDEATVRRLCDRRLGVGCDQLLLLSPHAEADVALRIFNNDGSEAAHCGNGARCVAAMLMAEQPRNCVKMALQERTVRAYGEGDAITLEMGKVEVTMCGEHHADVTIGNRHRVYFDGSEVFDPSVNIEIITGHGDDHLWIDIIERGAGRTPACGSGACAVAAAWWQRQQNEMPLTIVMPGGEVRVSGNHDAIKLSGVVHTRFHGEIDIC